MVFIKRAPRKPRRQRRKHVWLPSQKHSMTTRFGRKVSVCNASIHTAELLESILLHMDLKDLQRARQVCKAWNAIIDASPVLQRCLFVRAEESKITWVLDPLTKAMQPYRLDRDDSKVDQEWFARQGACVPAVLNTNFLSRDTQSVTGVIDIRQRFDRAESLKFNADLKSFNAASTIAETYLTQPPCKEIVVYLAHRTTQPRKPWTPRLKNESRFDVFVEGGVKWSDLLNAMRDQLSTNENGEKVARRVWIDTELSKVWVIGSVFYNGAEHRAIMTGEEAEGLSSSEGDSACNSSYTSTNSTTSSIINTITSTGAETGTSSIVARRMSQSIKF